MQDLEEGKLQEKLQSSSATTSIYNILTKWQATIDRMRCAAAAIFAQVCAGSNPGRGRRYIQRAYGKWRGSTMAGYLFAGDDAVYKQNFRMSKETFARLVTLLMDSKIAAVHTDMDALRANGKREVCTGPGSTAYARVWTDPPTTQFKVGTCLYAMGHGGPLKLTADVSSMGVSTIRRWMNQFCMSVMDNVKPIYMPATPFSEPELRDVRANFAARRSIMNVALACDGSHIPYKPKIKKKHAIEYRNYKGWTSMLAVAFVDSYYRFFELDVGAAGRAGDNTVLRDMWLMQAIAEDPDKWLGPQGVILGDSGASDGDNFFLNPYHSPSRPEQAWFNFCHSSTRFFVEETFGRWKNRWRFLIHPSNTGHDLTMRMTYTSAILHNLCTVHARDGMPSMSANSPEWEQFFEKYAATRCFACRDANVGHCIHQSAHRIGRAQHTRARQAPSKVRDELCDRLWEDLLNGTSALMPAMTSQEVASAQADGTPPQVIQQVVSIMDNRSRQTSWHE